VLKPVVLADQDFIRLYSTGSSLEGGSNDDRNIRLVGEIGATLKAYDVF
jgi:hypothetical protein